MKNSKFKKILMLFALIIVVQNGAVISQGAGVNADSYSEEDAISPCSDLPPQDTSYS